MMRFVYNLLFPVGLLLFLPAYIVKMFRRGNYRHKFGQRFGFYDRATRAQLRDGNATWVHAVSVGEVAVALKLIDEMRRRDPRLRFVLTTTTTTGFAFANRGAGELAEVLYNPLDFWPIVRRAFAVIRPARLVLVEAEVWPNLVAIARARRVPVALVNARLSARSESRFRRFNALVAPTFRKLDLVCVQEPRDVQRWSALGVPRERIQHVGSIKYDPAGVIPQSGDAAELGAFCRDRPVLFGGSTHAGEEEILAAVFQQLRTEFPELMLIIAPRHVERTAEVRDRLQRAGIGVVLRTEISPDEHSAADCVILNTTGELQSWYSLATVVFIGKSLTARGGQNPVEPILAGKPVVFGPHMENFRSLAEALAQNGGGTCVSDADSLAKEIARLLADRAAADQMVARARAALAPHLGATARTAELVLQLRSAGD